MTPTSGSGRLTWCQFPPEGTLDELPHISQPLIEVLDAVPVTERCEHPVTLADDADVHRWYRSMRAGITFVKLQ